MKASQALTIRSRNVLYLPSYALFSDGGQRAHAVHIKADLIRRLTYTKGYLDFKLYSTLRRYIRTYVRVQVVILTIVGRYK